MSAGLVGGMARSLVPAVSEKLGMDILHLGQMCSQQQEVSYQARDGTWIEQEAGHDV